MIPVFGIYIGNTNAYLALYKQQDESRFSVDFIVNEAGNRLMPAIVTLTENENVVGAGCKSLMSSHWKTTITDNKRMIEKDIPEEQVNGERKVATVLKDGELCYEIPLDNSTEYYTPLDIFTWILNTLYETAKSAVPGQDNELACVLLVPGSFSEDTCAKVAYCAESVGWDVRQLVSEPSAAVIGYDLFSEMANKSNTEEEEETMMLVYRVGGKSCEATLLAESYGMVSVVDTYYSEEVGGKFLINILTQYLADVFYRRYKLDPNESIRALTKLMLAAETCLHVLSTSESANCFVESLCEGIDFNHTMSRARFESLLFPHLATFTKPLHLVMDRQNISFHEVSKVLLCGGSMKIPRLNKHISSLFRESQVVPLPNGINYDEVMVSGAANHGFAAASEKMKRYNHDCEIPVLGGRVIFEVEMAKCEKVEYPIGQPLPILRTVKVSELTFGIQVNVTQLPESPEDEVLRGEVYLPPSPDIEDPTDLYLDIDRSGIKVGVKYPPGVFTRIRVPMYAEPNVQ